MTGTRVSPDPQKYHLQSITKKNKFYVFFLIFCNKLQFWGNWRSGTICAVFLVQRKFREPVRQASCDSNQGFRGRDAPPDQRCSGSRGNLDVWLYPNELFGRSANLNQISRKVEGAQLRQRFERHCGKISEEVFSQIKHLRVVSTLIRYTLIKTLHELINAYLGRCHY